jgi:hypothetical protein
MTGQEGQQRLKMNEWAKDRLGDAAKLSYTDIYQQVLAKKADGRTRVLGPINRLTARYQAARIARGMKNIGGPDSGDLLTGNRSDRRAAREAAERTVLSDNRETRTQERNAASAERERRRNETRTRHKNAMGLAAVTRLAQFA